MTHQTLKVSARCNTLEFQHFLRKFTELLFRCTCTETQDLILSLPHDVLERYCRALYQQYSMIDLLAIRDRKTERVLLTFLADFIQRDHEFSNLLDFHESLREYQNPDPIAPSPSVGTQTEETDEATFMQQQTAAPATPPMNRQQIWYLMRMHSFKNR